MAEDMEAKDEAPSEEDVRAESLPEKCPRCGTAIDDDDSETCPKCGADLVPPAGVKIGRIIAILVILLLVVGIALFAIYYK